jgi:uncharacterized protein (DUF1778 family)
MAKSDDTVRLSAEGQIRFAEMLVNPPEPNAAMKRAKAAHRRLIVSSDRTESESGSKG